MTPHELAVELGAMSAKVTSTVFDAFDETATQVRDTWRADAAATVAPHAKNYPAAITAEMRLSTDIVAAIGPEEGIGQGFLGRVLELGGRHSQPFLHGLRAMEAAAPSLEKAAAEAVEDLIP